MTTDHPGGESFTEQVQPAHRVPSTSERSARRHANGGEAHGDDADHDEPDAGFASCHVN